MSTITVKRDLLESCKDREYREALNLENVYASVCGQMRNIREQQELSQAELGRKAKMAQERISILEDPNAETKPTLKTLLRVAGALDVGLEVRFIPFSRVLETSVDISDQQARVDSFEKELPSIEEKLTLEDAVADLQISSASTAAAKFNIGDWIDWIDLGAGYDLASSNASWLAGLNVPVNLADCFWCFENASNALTIAANASVSPPTIEKQDKIVPINVARKGINTTRWYGDLTQFNAKRA